MSTKSLTKNRESLPALFDDFFRPWNEWLGNGGNFNKTLTLPAVNISENNEECKLAVAAPGLKKADLNLDVEGSTLIISSEKEETKEEKDARYNRKEYSYTSFSRSFTLPDDVNREKIDATYADGVLQITLPKKEEARRVHISKHIEVK